MFLAHAPISFLANKLIQRKKIAKLKQNERVLVGVAAILCGILPDFDMFVLLGTTTPTFMHHAIISHTPIFYIALWGLLNLLFWIFGRWFNRPTQKFFNPEFVKVLLNTFLIATLVHLLADVFAENIMLLYPFSTQYFTLFKYAFEPNLFAGYFFGINFGIELIFCAIFFIYVLLKAFKNRLVLKIINILLVCFALLFLSFNIYIHFNTYNKSIAQNYDADYDTLPDNMDMDVNNNGKDNIINISLQDLVVQVKDILASNKWTANLDDSSITGKLRYKAGGLTSFRLIAQAYFNLHSPIEPVLKDMLTKDDTVEKYSWDYNSQNAFFKYFKDKNMLVELDQSTDVTLLQGAIFFVVNDKNEVLNMGIALENNNIGIVLPYDKNVKLHTLKELNNYYGSEVKIMITE